MTFDETTIVQKAIKSVGATEVNPSSIGPTWGASVAKKALTGLIVFLVLVVIFIWAYFREWRMSVAALVALAHDLVITVGVYSLTGFEVSPATVTGFLTILGYSLYDTVVVFDKARENTRGIVTSTRRTYAESANLAVNQTLV
ncbi:MAG: protein translocase subunit SecF, partial [Nocardioidaceae bacterium]